MAEIKPFRGLRFNTEKIDRMENVVTPPYDVIDKESQQAFMEKNPCNMIQLDLTKQAGDEISDERYQDACNKFNKWQEEKILIRDEAPTIYLYFIDYSLPSGEKFTRKGLVSLVGLTEFSEGVVKPHEKTFRAVTSDRLRLLDTCRAQFSQVFSLYSDKLSQVMTSLEKGSADPPLYSVEDQDGCLHRIWPVTDPDILAEVTIFFHDKSLYIADGHHRYTTALRFRKLMRDNGEKVQADTPWNRIMMYLCPMEDPGLSVLPTHRLVTLPDRESAEQITEKLTSHFEVSEIKAGSREMLTAEALSRMAENKEGLTTLGLYHPREDRCFLLTMKKNAMDEIGRDMSAAIKELDVVVLSDLVLESLLGLDHKQCEKNELIRYYSDPDVALDVAVKEAAAAEGERILFLMNNTPVYQVKKVADQNLVMPHKSTYFYPKILTGLLLNKFGD